MIQGGCVRSPGICFNAEENSAKPHLGDRRWRLCDQSSPQMGSLSSNWGRYDRIARQEGRRKERTGSDLTDMLSVVHGAMDCGQKSFQLVLWYHQLPSGFWVKGQLPRVSRQSHLSANDKVMRCYQRLCIDLLAFALRLTKTPENLSQETVW